MHSCLAIVVYHLVPTSNHNHANWCFCHYRLFIILFLHQTTTPPIALLVAGRCLSSCSYIKPQRFLSSYANLKSCLSSCSYIKPQLINPMQIYYIVVYHLVPTSNHNVEEVIIAGKKVVYHLVPTSNHNSLQPLDVTAVLFIILFLHQTTTCGVGLEIIGIVVYHLVPTSNHNSLRSVGGRA